VVIIARLVTMMSDVTTITATDLPTTATTERIVIAHLLNVNIADDVTTVTTTTKMNVGRIHDEETMKREIVIVEITPTTTEYGVLATTLIAMKTIDQNWRGKIVSDRQIK